MLAEGSGDLAAQLTALCGQRLRLSDARKSEQTYGQYQQR
jgi:hypothetical protein